MKINILLSNLIIIILILTIYKYFDFDQINVWLLNRLIILRGVLAQNCVWYAVSDILLSNNGSGIKTYNKFKQKYGDFAPSYMFGEKIYTVTNNKYIKIIFDNSPDLFSVGNLKMRFFRSFMEKNVGVSTGCPWKARRYMNEFALNTGMLHTYAEQYNNDIIKLLTKWKNISKLGYPNFVNFGKTMVAKIVFNTDCINNDFFKIFSEANTTEVFFNPDFKINPEVYNNYLKTLNHYIAEPEPNSLVKLCLKVTNNKEEIRHQIPHFIFPIAGLFITTIPRLLLLLCNHKKIFRTVIKEVHSLKGSGMNNYKNIYKLTYLRKCILETLRLNNPVITTFKTLTQDYSFDDKHNFKKGEQFLILNNPVLREKEFFEKPNKFMPSRWTADMEKSYYAISFNQGPQRCPGKELAIYLAQSFMYNFIKIKEIGINQSMRCKKINTKKIEQVINPCTIKFYFVPF
jgi:hypothetical protein